jgi:serine/threonine protein kinase
MAPESLVDGVFTCQSDVWAFGVLIWEIMTLGQQPYPARTNLEVLHYVRNGGRLGRPNNCPEELYVANSISLMHRQPACMLAQDSKPFTIHVQITVASPSAVLCNLTSNSVVPMSLLLHVGHNFCNHHQLRVFSYFKH